MLSFNSHYISKINVINRLFIIFFRFVTNLLYEIFLSVNFFFKY